MPTLEATQSLPAWALLRQQPDRQLVTGRNFGVILTASSACHVICSVIIVG
jgi:hypothetical protein